MEQNTDYVPVFLGSDSLPIMEKKLTLSNILFSKRNSFQK